MRELEHISRFCRRTTPWDNLLMIAEMEGVAGLLYFNLKSSGILNTLSRPFTEKLEKINSSIRERTSSIIEEAEAISKILKQAGIPVVALQGLSLMTIYGDPCLRPLGDADLMVKPVHRASLRELLCAAGYQNPIETHPNIFLKNSICIDIHTHVLNLDRIRSRQYLFPADLTSMWDRTKPLFDRSGDLLSLDPFDNFIALTAHALKHGYSRLIWLVDLHESLLKMCDNANCYENIIERARFWHQERIVIYALILVEEIFGMRTPVWFKKELGINRLNVLEKYLLLKKIRGRVQRELFNLLWLYNIKKIANKIEFIKETAFPRDEISVRSFNDGYPNRVGFVYAKRLGKVITKVGKVFSGS